MSGSVRVQVPAASATLSVTVPDVVPLKRIEPVVPAATPTVMSSTKVGELASTTAPVPVTAEIPVPLIEKTFPAPAVS